MALEENEARPRLLIVRGSFATMGGAERELLQLIRMAHGRWDVHLATLDISEEAQELMLPATPTLIKPPTNLNWPEGAVAEVTAAASKAAQRHGRRWTFHGTTSMWFTCRCAEARLRSSH